jgi:hypothetical protein
MNNPWAATGRLGAAHRGTETASRWQITACEPWFWAELDALTPHEFVADLTAAAELLPAR